jgi:hypothetical protein
LQPDFRLLRLWYRLSLEQDATETMDFRFSPAFVMLLYERVGLVQCLKTVCGVA